MRLWAVRTIVLRGRSQAAILGVVAVVTFLACTLLATLAVISDASTRFAVNRALITTSATDTRVRIDATLNGRPLGTGETAVGKVLDRTFGSIPTLRTEQFVSTTSSIPRTSLGAVGAKLGDDPFVYFGAYDDFAKHARLVVGRWPAIGAIQGKSVEVAVPVSLGADLRVAVGSTIRTEETLGPGVVRARIVGTYVVTDPAGPFWSADPFDGQAKNPNFPAPFSGGTVHGVAYGPLVTAPDAFRTSTIATDTLVTLVAPNLSRVSADQLPGLQQRTTDLPAALSAEVVDESVVTTTNLSSTIDSVRRFLLVTRTSVIITSLMLLVLALAALLLATRLLAERRSTEQSLMRARGTSQRQLVRLALLEALFIGTLTTIPAPFAARQIYDLIASRPVFRAAGMHRDPGYPLTAWLVAAGTALLFGIVLVAPLLRRGTTFVEQEQAAARQDRRGVLVRSGVDVAIAALAGLAYWQLRSYKSPLVGGHGRLRLDPVLAAGPAICLLAGALVAVRLVPVLSRGLERLAARGRSIVGPLAAWEIGRRPRRAIGAVLLLTLALAVGTFSLSYLATWRTSQRDQADFSAGTDVRLTDPRLPVLAQSAAMAAIPGASAVSPVGYRTVSLGPYTDVPRRSFLRDLTSGSGQPAQLIAARSAAIPSLLRGRTVAPGGMDHALVTMAPRLTPLPVGGGITLPAADGDLHAHVRLGSTHIKGLSAFLAIIVQDGTGVRTVVNLGSVDADGKKHSVSGTLPTHTTTRAQSSVGHLQVVGVQAVWVVANGLPDASYFDEVAATINVANLTVAKGKAVEPVLVEPSFSWSDKGSGPGVDVTGTRSSGTTLLSATVHITSGWLREQNGITVWDTWKRAPVGAIVTPEVLGDVGAAVGDQLFVGVGSTVVTVTVAGTVPSMPSTTPGEAVVYVDADALSRALIQAGGGDDLADEWWAAFPSSGSSTYAAAVKARGLGKTLTRDGVRQALEGEPLRVGFVAALWLAIIGSVVFAAAGFAMHTTVAIRLRRVEFAQLRAIGISRRSITAIVAVENLLLGVLGTVFGVTIGALLGWLVGPLVALSSQGSAPVPAVLVHVPWLRIALLAVEVAALLGAVVLTVTRVLRGSVLGSSLRLGDER